MCYFIGSHCLKYGTATGIISWESREVRIEMAFHLSFCFDDKAEAGAIAEQRGRGADRERAGVPQRIQQTRVGLELLQTSLAPGQMIGFFLGGFEKKLTRCSGTSDQGLAVVERLGGDFTGVVYPHEGGGFALLDVGQGSWRRGGRYCRRLGHRRGLRQRP